MANPVDVHDDLERGKPTLLFVCIANVCRSPTMQFMTAQHLTALGAGLSWSLTSAGTAAVEGDRMCATSAAAVRELPGGTDFAATHRARLLNADRVQGADLILVATHSERPVLTQLSPEARARTFTMVEAALLAEAALRGPRLPWRDEAPLASLVANMHAARGTVSPPPGRGLAQRLLARTHVPHGLDIRDVHSGHLRSHHQTLEDLRWASQRLARAMAGIPSPRSGR